MQVSWWEEAESRALRSKGPATLGHLFRQRFEAAGIASDLIYLPSYDLAHLAHLCGDLVKLVESILVCADGDRRQLRREALVLARWADYAHHWAHSSAFHFNQLMDGLQLDPEQLEDRESEMDPGSSGRPEEEPKVAGRYRHWHLLYERLDLKFTAVGMDDHVRQGLARCLARIYEHSLITLRLLAGLERNADPRFRAMARLLLDINSVWHFDLGPYHLGYGQLRLRGHSVQGLQAWLMQAFLS